MSKQTDIREAIQYFRENAGNEVNFREERLIKEYDRMQADRSGMAIKVLSIFGGLLATSIFLAFVGIAGLYDNYQGIMVLGILFIAISVSLNKIFNMLIIDTSSIAMYVIGFSLLQYALAEYAYSGNQICAIFIAIAFGSILIAQNFILVFVSVLIINGCFIALVLVHENLGMIHVYNAGNALLLALLMLFEARFISAGRILSRLYNPLRIALIFSLLAGLFFVGKRWFWHDFDEKFRLDPNHIWFSSVVIIAAILYLIYKILGVFGRKSTKDLAIAYAVCVPVLLSMSFLPAVLGSMLIILMSFFVNYKTGFIIGIMGFIYFISQFYYDLHFSLLTKSLMLMGTGVLFILCFVFIQLKWRNHEKV